MPYIDGFLIPVPRRNRAKYRIGQRVADRIAVGVAVRSALERNRHASEDERNGLIDSVLTSDLVRLSPAAARGRGPHQRHASPPWSTERPSPAFRNSHS